jgi:predicted phosphodiesterase
LTEEIEVGELLLFVVHQLSDLHVDPKVAGYAAVISGHSHRPAAEHRDGVLYLNPGSAGPRRFRLPISIARVRVAADTLSHEIVELAVANL